MHVRQNCDAQTDHDEVDESWHAGGSRDDKDGVVEELWWGYVVGVSEVEDRLKRIWEASLSQGPQYISPSRKPQYSALFDSIGNGLPISIGRHDRDIQVGIVLYKWCHEVDVNFCG